MKKKDIAMIAKMTNPKIAKALCLLKDEFEKYTVDSVAKKENRKISTKERKYIIAEWNDFLNDGLAQKIINVCLQHKEDYVRKKIEQAKVSFMPPVSKPIINKKKK